MPSQVLYDRWLNLACGFLVFLFFGLGKDAKNMYREWLVKMGLGRLISVLEAQSREVSRRGEGSSNNSRIPLKKNSSWIKTER